MNWHGYECRVEPGYKPFFYNLISYRQNKQLPIVILIQGGQGSGKTYCGIRLGEIIDKKFDPQLQIAMNRREIMHLISGNSPLKRDQVIIIDESQFSMSSRRWTNKEQQDFMDFLAAGRFYGYVIMIIALHQSMLDLIARAQVINYTIHVEDRGLGIVYENRTHRFEGTSYKLRMGKLIQQLPDYDRCNYITCLTCKHKGECMTTRAVYERKKKDFITKLGIEKEKRAAMRAAKDQVISDDEILETLYKHRSELSLTTYNNIDSVKVKHIIERELGLPLGNTRSRDIAKRVMLKYPTIMQTP